MRGDANGAWDEGTARAALEALAPLGFEYVEQPLPASDVVGLAALRRRSPVRVAADESVATAEGALRLIECGAVDVVVLQPATLGGALRTLEIAALARHAGIGVVFSQAFESAVGAHHALHCAAAWGDADAVHGLCTAGLFAQDVAAPVACTNGATSVGAGPGIGVTMITMLLGGLWHGASWNFVFWGFYHGLLLTVHRAVPWPSWLGRNVFIPLRAWMEIHG